jgi:uncharacterized membrane protein YbhN (UPF0104 family)
MGVLVWRVGTGPFLDALRRVDASSLAAATGIAVVTTVCCAWRWTLVARGLGVALPVRSAVAAYYRSQFLNVALPGGVLGDLHRGVRHGRDVGHLGRGVRSVVWERSAGQAVQAVLAGCVLVAVPSPLRPPPRVVGAAVVAAALALVVLAWIGPHPWPAALSRAARAAAADLRAGVLGRRALPGIVGTSGVAVAGHVATFLIAARSAGSAAPALQLLPLALLVLVAMGVPLALAGFGPREGMAAWAFGAAGFGVDHGVTAAVVYGVLVLVASLPGAALMLVSRLGGRVAPACGEPDEAALVGAGSDGAAHG